MKDTPHENRNEAFYSAFWTERQQRLIEAEAGKQFAGPDANIGINTYPAPLIEDLYEGLLGNVDSEATVPASLFIQALGELIISKAYSGSQVVAMPPELVLKMLELHDTSKTGLVETTVPLHLASPLSGDTEIMPPAA